MPRRAARCTLRCAARRRDLPSHTHNPNSPAVEPTKQCLKYKTDQLVDVKRMEKLNNLMFALMARGPDASLGEHACEIPLSAPYLDGLPTPP